MRCTSIGTAIVPRPRKKRGAKKDMASGFRLRASGCDLQTADCEIVASTATKPGAWSLEPGASSPSSDPHEFLAARQITEQRAVQRLGRVDEGVIDPLLRELRRQGVDVFPD